MNHRQMYHIVLKRHSQKGEMLRLLEKLYKIGESATDSWFTFPD